MKTKFEIGKAYQHHSEMQMFICGMADTILIVDEIKNQLNSKQ